MGVSVIAEAQQSKPSAPLPVPQWIVDDARLVGRSFGEVGMMGVFVQLNEKSKRRHLNPVGYILQENGCWDWVGHRNKWGYGIWSGKNHPAPAHRTVYEMHRGPIPKGLQIDHLCRNRGCVNPDHLEAVTGRVNVLRGIGPSAQSARKTQCPKGHPYSDENTYRTGTKSRRCRECNKRNCREYESRRKNPRKR